MSERTLLDIELAKLYFEVLVTLAKTSPEKTITYGDLVKETRSQFANNPIVQSAIATNIGRRLDALREFTSSHQLPDLSALAVNQDTGDNGVGFKRSFDGDFVRQQIAAFDWNAVRVGFDDFITHEKHAFQLRQEKKKRPKKISETEAREIWWNFAKGRKAETSQVTLDLKEKIIQLITNNVSPQEAMQQVCGQSAV